MFTFIFFAIPILTAGFFISSLVRYIKARKANKKAPGSFSDEVMKERKISLIFSSILTGLFVAVTVWIIVLMFMSVAYM